MVFDYKKKKKKRREKRERELAWHAKAGSWDSCVLFKPKLDHL
jgi:hypothetical protein